jgi:hypothetical protein
MKARAGRKHCFVVDGKQSVQPKIRPPLTLMVWPVTNAASSLVR